MNSLQKAAEGLYKPKYLSQAMTVLLYLMLVILASRHHFSVKVTDVLSSLHPAALISLVMKVLERNKNH